MRRTTPDLVGTRKTVFHAVTVVLLVLTVAYVLWTNYVVFVGGNLPLTPIDLGEGSTGAGLAMLAVGDLIIVLLVWLFIQGVLLNLLYTLLIKGQPRTTASAPPSYQPGQPPYQPQPPYQGQQQWQPQGQQQWQPEQQWQPQQQWQQNPWPSQPQQGPWQQGPSSAPPPPPPGAPYPPTSGSQERLVGPDGSGWHSSGPNSDQFTPENSSR